MTIHPVQSTVLKQLKSTTAARFNDLKPDEMTSDHFNFHIQRLQKMGLVTKQDDGTYSLTAEGKSFANKLDDTQKSLHAKKEQPKISALYVISKDFNGQPRYVAKRRVQHPFIDHLAFPTWGLEMGVKLTETTARYLPLTTGLSGIPKLVGQIRRLDRDPVSDAIINDIILLVVRIDDPVGELTNDHNGAEQMWVSKPDMLADQKLTGIPPHVFTMIEEPASPRLVELEFTIKDGGF